MAARQPFVLNTLPAQLNKLDERIQRVESALEKILERLGMPKLDVVAPVKEPEKVVEVVKTGPYVYKPLDATKNEIRLLCLHSNPNAGEPVKAQLMHFSLDDDGAPGSAARLALRIYRTLSYTWGDASKKVNITLDGHQFPVTENLYAALKTIRNVDKSMIAAAAPTGNNITTYWWIDAICINQEDVLERNQQVTMMTMIYKRSRGVHIWLGAESEDSDIAMDLVAKMGGYKPVGPGVKEIVYPECSMQEKVAHWKALTKLYQRPWWERVWIRQEVAVPKSATVQCGTKTNPFEQMCSIAGVLHILNERLGYQPVGLEGYNVDQSASTSGELRISCYLRATMLQELRAELGRGVIVKYGNLTDMLFHTRSCKSTDPRDKVFSVLGLVDPSVYEVKPDYRISLDQAIKTVTRAIINKKQSLDVMAGSQNPEGANGLPTWVPNLTEEWKARPLKTKPAYYPELPDEPDFTFDPDDDSVLRANGRVLSSIAAVSKDSVTANATTQQLDVLYQNWKTFAQTLKEYPGLDRDEQRNLRDLVEDKLNDRKWLELLSLGTEAGAVLKYSEDEKLLPEKGLAVDNAYRNPKMVNSLLLPNADDEDAIKLNPYRRFHENLRKYGIGRKLAYMTNGSVGLVPSDSREGDEVCVFSNTHYPFILRKIQEGKHVVIGESYFPTCRPYEVPRKAGRPIKVTSFSIV